MERTWIGEKWKLNESWRHDAKYRPPHRSPNSLRLMAGGTPPAKLTLVIGVRGNQSGRASTGTPAFYFVERPIQW